MYHYKLKSTLESSQKFGKCAVCKKHHTETFMQVEEKEFLSIETKKIELTQFRCRTIFGCKECLIKVRK